MDFFGFLKRTRGSDSTEFLDARLCSLDITMQLASPFVEDRVKVWDEENPTLMLTLGYLLGYIDAAYQSTTPARYNEKLVEKILNARIVKYFTKIPGVDRYLELSALSAHYGGSSVAAWQDVPQFMTGTVAGGSDFVNFVNKGRTPLSLTKLLHLSPSEH